MIDNVFNKELKNGNIVMIKYCGGDEIYFLTCRNNEEKYYTISRDNEFIIVKRYSPSLKRISYIPLNSVISVTVDIIE